MELRRLKRTEEKAKQAGAVVALGLVTFGVVGGLLHELHTRNAILTDAKSLDIDDPSAVPNPGGAASSSREGDGTMMAEPQEDT